MVHVRRPKSLRLRCARLSSYIPSSGSWFRRKQNLRLFTSEFWLTNIPGFWIASDPEHRAGISGDKLFSVLPRGKRILGWRSSRDMDFHRNRRCGRNMRRASNEGPGTRIIGNSSICQTCRSEVMVNGFLTHIYQFFEATVSSHWGDRQPSRHAQSNFASWTPDHTVTVVTNSDYMAQNEIFEQSNHDHLGFQSIQCGSYRTA
jgi:hypothetical protein